MEDIDIAIMMKEMEKTKEEMNTFTIPFLGTADNPKYKDPASRVETVVSTTFSTSGEIRADIRTSIGQEIKYPAIHVTIHRSQGKTKIYVRKMKLPEGMDTIFYERYVEFLRGSMDLFGPDISEETPHGKIL